MKQANQKEEWEKALNNYSSHLPQKVKSRIHHTRATMIDGKLKAGMEIRDALNATVAKYESLHSNVDNSIGEQTNALAAVITNLTVELVDIQAKILDVTSRQVSSLPVRDMVLWFFTREVSNHYVKKVKVLLSNWNNVTEYLTGVTSIPMSVSLLDRTPLTSMMQQHQKLLQIMSNGKFNCMSEIFSRIMLCFCRSSQALEDVRACRHTKLDCVSSCTTNTATCHWVQSSKAKSHLGQHISLRSPLRRSARSRTTTSQDDSFLFPQQETQWYFLRLGIVIG